MSKSFSKYIEIHLRRSRFKEYILILALYMRSCECYLVFDGLYVVSKHIDDRALLICECSENYTLRA